MLDSLELLSGAMPLLLPSFFFLLSSSFYLLPAIYCLRSIACDPVVQAA